MSGLALLGGLSRQQFLEEYWQKKPLLVRQAVPDAASYTDADQLAGLSLERNIESRIIIGADKGKNSHWQLLQGPFNEKTYRKLPKTEWTLLVQAVNFYLPQFTPLLEQFDFIPQWRIDDVMVSYAAPGGSVGPHYDNYDVFLIQAQGQRHWRIGEFCGAHSVLRKHPHLRLLKEFEQQAEWVLEPGDMLYLPPRLAHYGIAVGECITYSVGFQAPSLPETAEYFCNDILERGLNDIRYTDPDLSLPQQTGLLTTAAIDRIKGLLIQALDDKSVLADWVARMLSEPKYDDHSPLASEPLSAQRFATRLMNGETLYRDEASRFLFTQLSESSVKLYINGANHLHPQLNTLVTTLCNHRVLTAEMVAPYLKLAPALNWLTDLHRQGLLYFANDATED